MKAPFNLKTHKADVLSCIANLSNDEVFTPPKLANQMLDLIESSWSRDNNGENIWENSKVTFFDPCLKTGVFLREITQRLNEGLQEEIPDLQERVDHILNNQVFGFGITNLTSLLARRSIYCSKEANSEHSISSSFDNKNGNVWYENWSHVWKGEKCKFCGANRSEFDREENLDSHAYAFIHTEEAEQLIQECFGGKMQFDVIIGNPPYQLSTGGFGTQAKPIYHKFVEQAKKLEPRYLVMVIPARWYSGGMGLDEFRASMLEDSRIRVIEDFPDSNDIFPGTQIKGGICYFLWSKEYSGNVKVTTHDKGKSGKSIERPLLEKGADIFIRYNEALPILKKIISYETSNKNSSEPILLRLPERKRFKDLVSSIGAFGLPSKFKGKKKKSKNDLKVYRNGGIGYLDPKDLEKEKHIVNKWKVFIPRAGSGSDSFPHKILGQPFVGEPGSISSWTYMHIGPFASEEETENVISYISTRLFRFLVLLHKPTQDATQSVYEFVPNQDFSRSWSDAQLYEKYKLTKFEIRFIESMIKPFE